MILLWLPYQLVKSIVFLLNKFLSYQLWIDYEKLTISIPSLLLIFTILSYQNNKNWNRRRDIIVLHSFPSKKKKFYILVDAWVLGPDPPLAYIHENVACKVYNL